MLCCKECKYLMLTERQNNRFFCQQNNKFYPLDDAICVHFSAREYSLDNKRVKVRSMKSMRKANSKKHQDNGVIMVAGRQSRRNANSKKGQIIEYTNTTSGCYITTIVCDILGFSDDCTTLMVLRKFRDNIMKHDNKYHSILEEYDRLGPRISECISKDMEKQELAQRLYNKYLIPTTQLINNHQYTEAVSCYKQMVNELKIKYESILLE